MLDALPLRGVFTTHLAELRQNVAINLVPVAQGIGQGTCLDEAVTR
jgi:hypothetical protein